jgi:hypothetical protein
VAVPKGRKIDTSNNFSVERVVTGVRALLNGTYVPPAVQPPAAPPALPAFRNVVVESGQKTFEDLADIHLDNSNRWVEIQALNPGITGLKPGQMIKIPNHAEMFAQLAR